MAVKVKIQKKRPTLKPEDYAVPGDKSGRQIAYVSFVVIALVLMGIAAFLAMKPKHPNYPVAVVLVLWVIVPWFIYFVNMPRRHRMKLGLQNRSMPTHHPEIRDLVSQQAKLLGVKEPEVFIIDGDTGTIQTPHGPVNVYKIGFFVIDGDTGYIQTLSGGRPYIVFTKRLLEVLKPEEFRCAMLMELGKIKSGHARAGSLLYFLNKTPRFLRGIFAMPVWFLGLLLWQSWEDEAEVTIDHLMLGLTRNPRLVAATVLKMQIEKDPVVNISPEEVDEYLQQQEAMKATTLEVSAHFKMGTTIHQNPELYERLRAFVTFTQSKEYQELCEKIKEVLAAAKPK